MVVVVENPVTDPGTDPPVRRRPSAPPIRFLATKLLRVAGTVAVLIPATFLLFRAVPGDAASVVIGPDVDPSLAAELRERYGLDQPLWEQFVSYLSLLLQGDLGTSFQYQLPVTELLAERLMNTAILVVPALLLAVVIGVALGAKSATKGGRSDEVLGLAAFTIKSAPIFWISTLALILFAYRLGLVPSIGMTSPRSDAEGFSQYLSLDFLHHLALPLTILVIYYLVEPMLTMRASMKEVLSEEFIQMGKAQGLTRFSLIYRHGARNATLPVVTLTPALADNVIGGQVIVETVFSWPGMGRAVVDAVHNFDYPMMQGVFLLTAVTVVVVNAVVDVLYAYLDPRVRL